MFQGILFKTCTSRANGYSSQFYHPSHSEEKAQREVRKILSSRVDISAGNNLPENKTSPPFSVAFTAATNASNLVTHR